MPRHGLFEDRLDSLSLEFGAVIDRIRDQLGDNTRMLFP
jgi:hypothetical protein